METELETDKDPSLLVIEDEKLKTAAKKGVSITVSLVMLGFSGWKDLEPGNYFSIIPKYNDMLKLCISQSLDIHPNGKFKLL